ncbi:MAG: thioredoxin domain-containing protein [Bacteroidetes bacterium]|nr:thioredoxin domain-containing protein [Bacteroidota bacterium]
MSDDVRNHLSTQSSPYLLQHAGNPVDWFPWSADTLALAREHNRMMLVSIGYASCHWCHVMAHESFEDQEVAAFMNRHFICIKVDREERPDVDHVLMEAVQMLGQRGGWPLNCFLMPDGRPVWGGTYFRRDQWLGILMQLAELFQANSPELFDQADQLSQSLQNRQDNIQDKESTLSQAALPDAMVVKLLARADKQHGGTLGAPKFPLPDGLRFLLMTGHGTHNVSVENHLRLSLENMGRGGIFDQLGGGFARYSVDDHWHIPHFEKMLYDNAQLIAVYAEAFRQYGDPFYASICRKTISFQLEQMRGDEAGFYAALDADSEGVEGKYYVWAQEEFQQVLGTDAELIGAYFGIGKQSFWENGRNVLQLSASVPVFCKENKLDRGLFEQTLRQATIKLLQYRNTRTLPGIDDKRLCGWNALMVSGLTHAAVVFGENEWLLQAHKTLDFLLLRMTGTDGRLYRTWKNGIAEIPAFLEDYALLIQALIDVYQAGFNETLLIRAKQLTDHVIENFYLPEKALFSMSAHDQQELIVNPVETYDQVMPSSNAVMCMALVKLGSFFEQEDYVQTARKMIDQVAAMMAEYPGNFTHWGQALYVIKNRRMLIGRGAAASAAISEIRNKLPSDMLVAATAAADSQIPALNSKPFIPSGMYWYCDSTGCRLPVSTASEILHQVDN